MNAKRKLVDTNLIVRYLVQDHEKHAKAAGKLFEACDRGEIEIVILSAVLAECVFVLESFYQHPRANIAPVLNTLLSSPGMHADANRVSLQRVLEPVAGFDLQGLANLPGDGGLSFPGDGGMRHSLLLTLYSSLTS